MSRIENPNVGFITSREYREQMQGRLDGKGLRTQWANRYLSQCGILLVKEDLVKEVSSFSLPYIVVGPPGYEMSDRALNLLENHATGYISESEPPEYVAPFVFNTLRRIEKVGKGLEIIEPVLHFNDTTIDLLRRTVDVAGKNIKLTQKEFDLVVFLAHESGIVFSRKELKEVFSSEEKDAVSRNIDTAVVKIRHKMGENVIRTVRGAGYAWGLKEQDKGQEGHGES